MDFPFPRILANVTEYCEGYEVQLLQTTGHYVNSHTPAYGAGRWVIKASNEGGHNSTEVDLLQLVAWLRTNRPDLLEVSE